MARLRVTNKTPATFLKGMGAACEDAKMEVGCTVAEMDQVASEVRKAPRLAIAIATMWRLLGCQ